MKKDFFDITGMTCSACANRIEKGVKRLPGIQEVSVNLKKNSMVVSYDESISDRDAIVQSAGTILTLITLGKTLEARAKGKTSDAITKLMDLAPKVAQKIVYWQCLAIWLRQSLHRLDLVLGELQPH